MMPHWIVIALAVALAALSDAAAVTANESIQPPPCNFSAYIDHQNVTSWEFQLDVPPDKCLGLQRGTMLDAVETALVQLTSGNASLVGRVQLNQSSLRTSVYDQVSTAVATLDGRPLSGKPAQFPWHGPAFIRHRKKYAAWQGKQASFKSSLSSFSVRPGKGDLTLKIKNVDLDIFQPLHGLLHFPKEAVHCFGGSGKHSDKTAPHLKWKIENDRYCTESRPTYEANFRPVKIKGTSGIRSFNDTERCFPGLWKFLKMNPEDGLDLPEYNRRSFSKSVWDIKVTGVPGVVNWVASYPTLLDALTGGETAAVCELSLRLKRASAEKRDGEALLKEALNDTVLLMEALHDNGWDTGVHGTYQA
jgi:hypothetical protein